MKSLLNITLGAALLLTAAPALAAEKSDVTFSALGQFDQKQQAALVPLNDEQLAEIQGGTILGPRLPFPGRYRVPLPPIPIGTGPYNPYPSSPLPAY
jgi:hypothetical protein